MLSLNTGPLVPNLYTDKDGKVQTITAEGFRLELTKQAELAQKRQRPVAATEQKRAKKLLVKQYGNRQAKKMVRQYKEDNL